LLLSLLLLLLLLAAKGQTKETHTEFCCCCQEKHFVVNMSKPADSYLAPKEQPHMMPLEDGRCVILLLLSCYVGVVVLCGQHEQAS
jgi:hypothetical protein